MFVCFAFNRIMEQSWPRWLDLRERLRGKKFVWGKKFVGERRGNGGKLVQWGWGKINEVKWKMQIHVLLNYLLSQLRMIISAGFSLIRALFRKNVWAPRWYTVSTFIFFLKKKRWPIIFTTVCQLYLVWSSLDNSSVAKGWTFRLGP